MDSAIKSHKELTVWRHAMQLAKDVYRLTDQFPRREEYRMTSQLIRAAISIPANIAEGNSRGTRRDYAHFVSIARGSAAELETLLQLASEIELAPALRFKARLTERQKLVACSMGYGRACRRPLNLVPSP